MEAIGTSGRPCRRGNETGAVCAETIYKPYVVAGCVAQSRVDARNGESSLSRLHWEVGDQGRHLELSVKQFRAFVFIAVLRLSATQLVFMVLEQ